MFKRDYRTKWQRKDDETAIAALDAIHGADLERVRPLAVDILLSRVHPDVADAYRRLQDRVDLRAST